MNATVPHQSPGAAAIIIHLSLVGTAVAEVTYATRSYIFIDGRGNGRRTIDIVSHIQMDEWDGSGAIV